MKAMKELLKRSFFSKQIPTHILTSHLKENNSIKNSPSDTNVDLSIPLRDHIFTCPSSPAVMKSLLHNLLTKMFQVK